MNSRSVVLANWFLDHFVHENESLAGDLLEEYRTGRRTRAWYWRQVLLAIVVEAAVDLRRHPLLTLRALAVGWGSIVAFNWSLDGFIYTLEVLTNGGLYVGEYWIRLPYDYYRWIYAHPYQRLFVISVIGWSLYGWIVGRFHRERPSMLVVFLATVEVVAIVRFVSGIGALHSYPWNVAAVGTGALITFGTIPLCILGGGIWATVPNKSKRSLHS